MKKLQESFVKWGHEFTQVKRNKKCAIYERKFADWKIEWEVIRIQVANEDYERFSIQKGDESYPSTEMWWTQGWTYRDFDRAVARYKKITDRKSTKV